MMWTRQNFLADGLRRCKRHGNIEQIAFILVQLVVVPCTFKNDALGLYFKEDCTALTIIMNRHVQLQRKHMQESIIR